MSRCQIFGVLITLSDFVKKLTNLTKINVEDTKDMYSQI